MKTYKRPLLSFLSQAILFIGLIGCLTPIDFPVEIAGGRLVVSGQISTIADQNIIQLGTTADIERLPFPVSGASIVLFDNNGDAFSYIEDSSKPGRYVLLDAPGKPGRTYHIEITLTDGTKYQSLPEKMPEGSVLNSVSHEVVKEDVVDAAGAFISKNFLKIYTNSTIIAPKTFLKWNVWEDFILSPTDFPDPFGITPAPCFIVQNADPQRVVQFDGEAIPSASIQGQLVASREIDWSFLEKHYFTTYQSSITREAFDYWHKVNILANQSGSIFDTPPAEIFGNIANVNDPSEKVLGFFQATNQSYQRFVLYPSDLPFRILNGKCDFDGSFNPNHYPPRCIDCASLLNSSYNRPDWF